MLATVILTNFQAVILYIFAALGALDVLVYWWNNRKKGEK